MWHAPHRPLFLFAALWALLTPSVWYIPDGYGPDPTSWHLHELLFGMGGAAVGGYLLTALPAWIKSGGVPPSATFTLSILWCVARLSFALEGFLPLPVMIVGALAYFAGLATLLARQFLVVRLWRKAWVILAVIALGAIDAVLIAWPSSLDNRLMGISAVLLFALLISLIGGRAIPAFTRRWTERSGQKVKVTNHPGLFVLSVAGMIAGGIFIWLERNELAGGCLMLSGGLNLARMAGWRSVTAARYPALFMLHLAWIWLPVGLVLIGLALIQPVVIERTDALHALTMGAMGTMIFAVMSRAVMERRGELLRVCPTLALAFAFVWLSTFVRVLGPSLMSDPAAIARVAALIWMSGWALFLVAYLPSLRGSVTRPVLSASSRSRSSCR